MKIKLTRPALFIVICLFLFVISFSFAHKVRGESFDFDIDPEDIEGMKEIDKDELVELSEREKEIRQELFSLQREIETLEEEKELINENIEETTESLEEAEKERKEHQEKLDELREKLKEVFSYLQRRSPLSYVEQVLSARDLGDFLRRLNIMRDVFSNINSLFSDFMSVHEELIATEEEIAQELENIKSLEVDLEENLAGLEEKEEEQRELLAQVEAEMEDFREHMELLEKSWVEQTRPLLLSLTEHLEGLLQEEELDRDMVDIGGTILNPTAELSQENFNSFFKAREELPEMHFEFASGEQVIMEVPEANMVFTGRIVRAGDSELTYEIEEARFFDIYLDEDTVRQLDEEIYIGFDFGPLMGNYHIEEVTVEEEKLVIDVKSIFF